MAKKMLPTHSKIAFILLDEPLVYFFFFEGVIHLIWCVYPSPVSPVEEAIL